jgi:hypothetical protein
MFCGVRGCPSCFSRNPFTVLATAGLLYLSRVLKTTVPANDRAS